MHKGIFREYDIRGVFGRDFDLPDAETIGRVFGTYLVERGGQKAVIGRDARLSSDDVRDALAAGMQSTGLSLVDIGICPTPTLYFALHQLEADGGVMVTASHNPGEYNGFKVCAGRETLYGEEIQRLWSMVQSGRFANGRGTLKYYDIIDDYVGYLIQNVNIARPVSLALDAGNGTAGIVAGPLFDRLGLPVERLHFKPDGRFPNHTPDPTVEENLQDLARAVRDNKHELGIGWDGDMDRIGIVDELGRMIPGDMLLCILARDLLRQIPGATIIADVKCSQNLFEDIAARGGRAVMWKSGHSLVKVKRRQLDAPLAGEMSGHVFYGHRWFGFDDGLYVALRLLEIVARRPEPVSEYLGDLPPIYNTPELRLDCPEEVKFPLVEAVREELSREHEVTAIDGVRARFEGGWALVRASNTGPVLVMRFEADSAERLVEIRAEVEAVVDRCREGL